MNARFDITNVRLETERLILREWTLDDLDDFYEYASVPGVGEMAGWPHHNNKEESLAILNHFIEGKHTFAIQYKENNKVIGSIGVEKYGLEGVLTEFYQLLGREIGYVLSKDYWGMGIMPEAVKAVIDYLFNYLNYDFLLCGHYDKNNQSARVQEKCGFEPYRKLVFDTKLGTKEPGMLRLLLNPKKKINLEFSHPESLIYKKDERKEKEIRKPKKWINILLIILFALSILCPFAGLVLSDLVYNASLYPTYGSAYSEYMWVNCLFLPITLLSLALGIIFKIKHYRCIKNIIVGAITSFVLVILGTTGLLLGTTVRHDTSYLRRVETILNQDFPDDYYISISSNLGIYDNIDHKAGVHFVGSDIADFEEYLKSDDINNKWITELPVLPVDFIDYDSYIEFNDCDYYCLYDFSADKYNNVNKKEQHMYYLLGYKMNDDLLKIIELHY